jgi:hypothetical protein
MRLRRFNWPLWIGFLLTIVAFISYFAFFARFPITRDIPWLNLLLFVIAMVLLVVGVRRSQRKIGASIVGVIGIAVFAFFISYIAGLSRRLPASVMAPRVGQKAPDFSLLDSHRQKVTLSQLRASSPRGVLLVFYRGYW